MADGDRTVLPRWWRATPLERLAGAVFAVLFFVITGGEPRLESLLFGAVLGMTVYPVALRIIERPSWSVWRRVYGMFIAVAAAFVIALVASFVLNP